MYRCWGGVEGIKETVKLNVNETNLTVEAESLPESLYFKHVLGLSSGDSVLLELRDPGILTTLPRPNQLVSIQVKIDGYREKATYQAIGTFRSGDQIFGSGDSINESLGAMMRCRNDWAELFGVDVKFPCNAGYHVAPVTEITRSCQGDEIPFDDYPVIPLGASKDGIKAARNQAAAKLNHVPKTATTTGKRLIGKPAKMDGKTHTATLGKPPVTHGKPRTITNHTLLKNPKHSTKPDVKRKRK